MHLDSGESERPLPRYKYVSSVYISMKGPFLSMACAWFWVPFTQFHMEEVFGLINIWAYLFIGLLQVAKSMETLISQSIATPNDPRREELEQMEKQKSVIDQKAKTLVQGELYCGLGFPGSPDTGLHEAHLLGTELGCDGAHLLLRDLAPLCRHLCLFPQNLQRTVVRGVLPAPIQGQAKAVDEDPQL